MSAEARAPLERETLMFYATISASVTHELNNVLSTVDQARGLLSDLVAGAATARPIDPRRVETVRDRIERQVSKGVEIVNRLNRFAHSIDEPAADVDAVAETENIVSLTRRFAELKRVRLEQAPGADEVRIHGDAFALQEAVFLCVRRVLEQAAEGERIVVAVAAEGADAVVTIEGPATGSTQGREAPMPRLIALMRSLGGVCRVAGAERGRPTFELRLPAIQGDRRPDEQG